jgi:hypothetical protein
VETIIEVTEKCLSGVAIVLVSTIDCSIDIPGIPTNLKKAQNASDSMGIVVYGFNSSYNKQAIQKKSE